MPVKWLEDLINKTGKVRLAQDAVMVEDLHHLLKDGRAAQKAYQRTMLGDEFPPAAVAEGDDVIAIDSPTTTTHIHQATQGLSPLGKIGMALAIAGPLGAAVVALPFILKALKPAEAPGPVTPASAPTAPPVGADWSTLYELRLGRP